jgi:hypothetical protein
MHPSRTFIVFAIQKHVPMNTLRAFFVMAMLMISMTGLQSQSTFNPKVGINASGVNARLNDITAEARFGWNVGFDVEKGKGFMYRRFGLHYYQYTAALFQEINTPGDIRISDHTTIQSVKMPLNLGLRLTGKGGFMNINAFGGITPTYVVNVQERNVVPFTRDALQDFSFGANAGINVDILIFSVDLNYELGLTPFFNGADGRNNVLTLSVGLKF